MLHNESRELLVQCYEKNHDAEATARAFSVSLRTVYRLEEQKRKTGSVELRTSQRGRKPILSKANEDQICQLIDEKPDITIQEIIEKLDVPASYSTVQRAIVRLGYTFKKKSLHASERERLRCTGKAEKMERRSQAGHAGSSGVSG